MQQLLNQICLSLLKSPKKETIIYEIVTIHEISKLTCQLLSPSLAKKVSSRTHNNNLMHLSPANKLKCLYYLYKKIESNLLSCCLICNIELEPDSTSNDNTTNQNLHLEF